MMLTAREHQLDALRTAAKELRELVKKSRREAADWQQKADTARELADRNEETALVWERLADALDGGQLDDIVVPLGTGPNDPDDEDADVDTEAYVESYVEVADAERDALRDEYVNGDDVDAEPAPAPVFAADDLVNVSDPNHKLFGTRGSVIGPVYDSDGMPSGVVVEYDNLGNTVTVTPAQLMHHTEFVKLPDDFFEAAEQAARGAESEA